MPRNPRPYKWNEAAGRYVGANGFVSRVAVRQAIDVALDNAARRMRDITQSLRNRDVTVAQWRLVMRREIKNVHLYSASAARGGWAQLTQSELGRVGAIVRREYEYLERFAGQLRYGRMPRDGRLLSRAQLYAQAGRRTFHVTDERVHLDRGYTEERNLTEKQPCPTCEEQEGRGWVPIGDLVPIGQRECLSNCRCDISYRKGPGDPGE